MNTYSHFNELNLTQINPGGWLRQYLEMQLNGLTGHLEECGHPTFRLENWNSLPAAENDVETWWPQEQSAYWIDGLLRCSLLLGDRTYSKKASNFLDLVLNEADPDGYLGPKKLKTVPNQVNTYRWPHAVLFRAMMAYHAATSDEKIVQSVRKHYLSRTSPHSRYRDVANIETILWAFEKSGDTELLAIAETAYCDYQKHNLDLDPDTLLENMLSDRRSLEHGVSFNEMAKIGAVLYLHTGDEQLLKASKNAYAKVYRDQMLVDGVHSSSENLRDKEPLESHETCNVSDYTWSLGYLLMATGESIYADKIERAMFNAAPGCVTKDFMTHQYFSSPNQVIATGSSDHNLNSRGLDFMAYRPYFHAPCCTGNVNRAMPNFAARLWMQDQEKGMVAVLYGPCQVSARVGASPEEVTIVEETNYPFSETVVFRMQTSRAVQFPLTLRIPIWCAAAEIWINDLRQNLQLEPGSFIKLDRVWENHDLVTLSLPMRVQLSRWPHNGVAVERGPLVFSLPVKEEVHQLPPSPKYGAYFPLFDLFPTSAWNYALMMNSSGNLAQCGVEVFPGGDSPFADLAHPPVQIKVAARKVVGWDLIHSTREKYLALDLDYYRQTLGDRFYEAERKGSFTMTPPLPDQSYLADHMNDEIETITLVPYGSTTLRLTIFPEC